VLMCPDIMSTGFAGAESGRVKIGDTVAVFAQGPIGLCAAAGARLMGATNVIAVDTVPERLKMSRFLGIDHVVDFKAGNPVEAIRELTGGRGVDVAIEALGTQGTFESALRSLRPGGTLSSLGVYSSDRRQGADASADVGDRCRSRRPQIHGHSSFHARQDRAGLRPVRSPAQRRSQGRHHRLS
jgi:alcohol dehydrogenase